MPDTQDIRNGLNQNINSQYYQQKQQEMIDSGKYNDPVRQFQARFLNFANSTKWVFYIPIGYILKDTTLYNQQLAVPLNCTRVTFPQFRIGTTKASFLNHSFDLSTRQNQTDKGLSVSYIVNENWFQYMMLLKWFQEQDYSYYTRQSNSGQQTKTFDKHGSQAYKQVVTVQGDAASKDYDLNWTKYGSTQGPMVPCNLYLLDNFNRRVCRVYFSNCWLASIGTIPLEYKKTSGTQIQSNFELKFAKYSIFFDSQYLKKMFGTDGISQETF